MHVARFCWNSYVVLFQLRVSKKVSLSYSYTVSWKKNLLVDVNISCGRCYRHCHRIAADKSNSNENANWKKICKNNISRIFWKKYILKDRFLRNLQIIYHTLQAVYRILPMIYHTLRMIYRNLLVIYKRFVAILAWFTKLW